MATSMLDFLTYDLSNTLLSDAVKHARQTKANKSKWADVVLQVKLRGKEWAPENTLPPEEELEIIDLFNRLEHMDEQEFNYTFMGWLGEYIFDANYEYIW